MLHSHTGTDTPASSVYKPEAMTADSLLMVRRLPAVLTGSLPAMASLEAQATLPTGADMLSKPVHYADPCPLLLAFVYSDSI